MEFKNNVIGPDFSTADLITFDFGSAEITLSLPTYPDKKPIFIAQQDQTAPFDNPTGDTRTHPLGFRITELIRQSWGYNHKLTENKIAGEHLGLFLIEVPENKLEEMNPLSAIGFKNWIFKFFRLIAVSGDESLLDTDIEYSEMQRRTMHTSIDEIECFNTEPLSWPIMPLRTPENYDGIVGDANDFHGPDYFIYIPLTDRLFLYIDLIHTLYTNSEYLIGRTKEEAFELKRAIRTEILSNIKVTYSPEVLAKINEKNPE